MIKIRLARGGVKNDPFYRIVAIDERRKREGKPADILGFWNPKKQIFKIDQKKLSFWRERGAQLTKVIRKLVKEHSAN